MKPKTFKNSEEFTRYIEGITGKPFKAAASTDGTTAYKYLSGQRVPSVSAWHDNIPVWGPPDEGRRRTQSDQIITSISSRTSGTGFGSE